MKNKEFKENYSKKVNKKPVKEKKKTDKKWVLTISILSFLISLFFSFIGEVIIPNAHIAISIFLIFVFIFLGIIFDMIGVAVTVADISTFNSMATKKVKGAKTGVRLIKNAPKVSSFCNDVIGDVCGIISGSVGVSIAIIISERFDFNLLIVTLLITAFIAAITIGGKALGKSYAINNSNIILYRFVKVISIFTLGR
jgi:CBS domain containing-hemolysin-like protein